MHRRLLGNTTTEPPHNNANRTSDSYILETNFDSNMVIILAALLCALICALGLNTLARCVLRCGHRFALETPEQAAVRLAATGIKKNRLRELPVVVYGEGTHIPVTECPICLGEFENGEKIRVLPKCNHGFHVRCIDTWLASHSSCPNCRHSLLEHQQPTKNTRASSEAVAESSSESEQEAAREVVLMIDEEAK